MFIDGLRNIGRERLWPGKRASADAPRCGIPEVEDKLLHLNKRCPLSAVMVLNNGDYELEKAIRANGLL